MAGHLNLSHDLLDPEQDQLDVPQSFAACLNARGLYNSMQFVLRLSPRVHALVDAATSGVYTTGELDAETIQAYSTYLHETVHWWQHVGSTSGLVLSLSYPGQTYTSLEHLRNVIKTAGPKKSLKEWAERAALAGVPPSNGVLMQANTAVNNALDVEYYKALTLQPKLMEQVFQDRYFESVGHSYHIAYAHALSMLAEAFDPDFKHLPNALMWEQEFMRLGTEKHIGFYHLSSIERPPVGLHALFEGQARFIQLQFLAFSAANPPSCAELRNAGYFNGIYVEAFEQFLTLTESEWPEQIEDPLIGLFLLICDLAINPSRGFPIDIKMHENFIHDVDPGLRFTRLCFAVGMHPELRTVITEYSREEYNAVSDILTITAGYDHPLGVLEAVTQWMTDIPAVAELMGERETFKYKLQNLPVRVMASHFLAFSADKLEHPEFFCWTGAWLAGDRVTPEGQQLFLTHLSLYSDRGDNDGIFPRKFPGKDYEGVMRTFNSFYANNILYDLTRQWILRDGPFTYDYRWLTHQHSNADMTEGAKKVFEGSFGAHPDAFEILK